MKRYRIDRKYNKCQTIAFEYLDDIKQLFFEKNKAI